MLFVGLLSPAISGLRTMASDPLLHYVNDMPVTDMSVCASRSSRLGLDKMGAHQQSGAIEAKRLWASEGFHFFQGKNLPIFEVKVPSF
jgi:hypothetical protein